MATFVWFLAMAVWQVELRDVAIGYRTVVAGHLSGRLGEGQLAGLIGVNGVGKSTLLRTISGLERPLGGEVLIGGQRVETYSRSELSRRLSVVLTGGVGVRGMTVAELVGLGRSPYTGFWGGLGSRDRSEVERALRLVGIEALGGRNVAALSDGERQKALIAKAIAQSTPIIVLDEPTAFLDYIAKRDVMRLLSNLAHNEGKTVLLSTHDLALAADFVDTAWQLTPDSGLLEMPPASVNDLLSES